MTDELDNGAVNRVLAELKDPETGRSALQLDQVRDIQSFSTGSYSFTCTYGSRL